MHLKDSSDGAVFITIKDPSLIKVLSKPLSKEDIQKIMLEKEKARQEFDDFMK